MVTSRERVLMALNHEEPDRVPVFFGTSGATSMLSPAYERFKAHLGLQGEPGYLARAFQYARIDEEAMLRMGSDGRPLRPGPAPAPLRREISPDEFVDEWGVHWRRDVGSVYYAAIENPLRHATLDDLERYPWPDLGHPSRFVGLRDEARRIHAAGYAVVATTGISPFEMTALLRGADAWMLDLAGDPEFAQALLGKVSERMAAAGDGVTAAAGDEIDIILAGDDLGTQDAPVISPAMYRRLVKPFHAEMIARIKRNTRAKLFFHSDGAIYPLLGDLVEIGVDILNPVQVSARGMGDTARLKREFGQRLSFCGAIDTQHVLPHGTPDDVRGEVRRRIADLGPGGGYILASVHCIQPDVPVENVLAMFDEARQAGRYPLADT
jgi:uroporphyrinogen decarboxylase